MFFLYIVPLIIISLVLVMNASDNFHRGDGFTITINIVALLALIIQATVYLSSGFIHPPTIP